MSGRRGRCRLWRRRRRRWEEFVVFVVVHVVGQAQIVGGGHDGVRV